jgi:hypothetical protein
MRVESEERREGQGRCNGLAQPGGTLDAPGRLGACGNMSISRSERDVQGPVVSVCAFHRAAISTALARRRDRPPLGPARLHSRAIRFAIDHQVVGLLVKRSIALCARTGSAKVASRSSGPRFEVTITEPARCRSGQDLSYMSRLSVVSIVSRAKSSMMRSSAASTPPTGRSARW